MARLWVLGDDVDTDALAPGAHMRLPVAEASRHCLESLRPEFAGSVRPGDVVLAGRNMGTGSSREQAVEALLHLGVAAVLAHSFAGIFHRNCINLGLPALVVPEALRSHPGLADGAQVRFDLGRSALLLPGGEAVGCEPLPGFLCEMIADGGLIPHLERRFAREAAG